MQMALILTSGDFPGAPGVRFPSRLPVRGTNKAPAGRHQNPAGIPAPPQPILHLPGLLTVEDAALQPTGNQAGRGAALRFLHATKKLGRAEKRWNSRGIYRHREFILSTVGTPEHYLFFLPGASRPLRLLFPPQR